MKKVYVVTGGSGGIGLESAKVFKDSVVLIADIDDEALAKGKAELEALGIEAHAIRCDVTSREQIAAMAKKAAELGDVMGVIHSAGVSGTVSNPDLVMKVDLLGSEMVAEEFLPYMQKGSSVVLVASMMGYAIPANPAYDALLREPLKEGFLDAIRPFHQGDANNAYNFAKHGVQILAEKWAPAYGEKGARINSLSPGIIETPMALKASEEHPETMAYMSSLTPLKRNGKPEDMATVVEFLCGEGAAFITGSDIRADGGLMKTMLSMKK